MCHYITAVLPEPTAHDDLDAIARMHGRRLEPLSCPGISSQLHPGERYFMTTVGHCDCGTPLGALARHAGRSPDWSAQERRLIRKGWSKAKAARAIAQKREVHGASTEASLEADREASAAWLGFIDAILGSGKTSYLGLLLHMYDGPVDAPFDLAGRDTVRQGDVSADMLGHMKEDVLYVFRA